MCRNIFYILSTVVVFSTILAQEQAPAPEAPPDLPPNTPEIQVPLSSEDTELESARAEVLRKFFDEWVIYMKDFDPSQMINFEIAAGEKRKFYETVDSAPIILRGAYSVSAKLKNKIKFTIYDPNGVPVVVKDQQREAIFYFRANATGEYAFEFQNRNVQFFRDF